MFCRWLCPPQAQLSLFTLPRAIGVVALLVISRRGSSSVVRSPLPRAIGVLVHVRGSQDGALAQCELGVRGINWASFRKGLGRWKDNEKARRGAEPQEAATRPCLTFQSIFGREAGSGPEVVRKIEVEKGTIHLLLLCSSRGQPDLTSSVRLISPPRRCLVKRDR